MTNQNIVRAHELKKYINKSCGLERDYIKELVNSRKNAWRAAVGFGITALLGLIAGILGLAQTTPDPFILRVDNTTGAVERITTTINEHQTSYGEIVDEYWLNQYVLNRESYDYDTIQINYDTTALLSIDDVQYEYQKLYFDGDKARDIILKDKARIIVSVRSIQTSGKGQATVRFTVQQINHQNIKLQPEHFIATIGYKYVNAPMQTSDRRINPLGFQVTSYRTAPETLGKN